LTARTCSSIYRLPGEQWQAVGPVLDASVISDEGGRGEHASFTGAFTGMAAFDTSGSAIPADFDRFGYIPVQD
jgi:xylan 1,4-beta-xylosidase